MRKSIFDLINKKLFDVKKEYIRIYKLFEEESFYYTDNSYISICEYIDKYFFKKWSKRGRCLTIDDMLISYNIRNRNGLCHDTMETLLLYIEAIINFIQISDIEDLKKNDRQYEYCQSDVYELLIDNINSILKELGYDIRENFDGELIIDEKENVLLSFVKEKRILPDNIVEYIG